MATAATDKNGAITVSALSLRTNLGKILRRMDTERRSLVIEKRGTSTAVLLKDVSRNDLVDLIAKPDFFLLLKPPSTSPLAGLRGRALHTKYCESVESPQEEGARHGFL